MMILQVLSFVFVMAVFGLFMGVIKPVLTWTNELTPIKQSASVMVTMFGGFGYTALLFIGASWLYIGIHLLYRDFYSGKCCGWSDIVYLAENKRL